MKRSVLFVLTLTLVLAIVAACAPTPEDAAPTPVPEAWRISIAQAPLPRTGCFKAAYPSMEWQETTCVEPPPFPMPPRRQPRPLVIGSGNDVSAEVPSGFISTAIGTFDSVTNVTSVSGPLGNSGAPVADAYTLQINTEFFDSTACAGSPNAACQGWEQFVFFNDGASGMVFIQYWLLAYNTACPAGWTQFSFTGDPTIYCYRSTQATPIPNQPITNLGQLSLSGTVGAGGDSVTFSDGTNAYSRAGSNAVNAAAGWTTAEFGVFGPGGNSDGGSEATFNNGAAIVPRVRVIYGDTAAPNCIAEGFTGETNNLSFGPHPPAPSQPGPALLVTESTAGGAVGNCAAAVTVGDTHLATFNGLFYDFQASGDFVLVQADPDFVVQARQVSGAPTWPDASVNHAVATRMGKTDVAVCLTEVPLYIDGKPTALRDGDSLSQPDGVDVWRTGNVYIIMDQSGNSVRAEVRDTWINVSVGLGRWPAKVSGLLANADGDVNAIATRDGEVLTNPFSFEELYHAYADSWRVESRESLLSVCGEETERGIPSKPFYADDLDPELAQRNKAICMEAGLKEGVLFDACVLDVAVIGDNAAANVFAGLPAPVAVGEVR